MSNIRVIPIGLLCVVLVGVGCSKSKEPAPKPDPKPSEGPVLAPPQQQKAPDTPKADQAAAGKPATSDATKPHRAASAEAAKIKANLASLSAEDRNIVEHQKICPVSAHALGEMGPPKKVKVAGQEVFICCASCEELLTQQPAKYLATVGLKPVQ